MDIVDSNAELKPQGEIHGDFQEPKFQTEIPLSQASSIQESLVALAVAHPNIDISAEQKEFDYVGNSMIDGMISVTNAGVYLGMSMAGGEILVEHAEAGLGSYIQGGAIVAEEINGDFANGMLGGKIEVAKIHGEPKPAEDYYGRRDYKIYVAGKLYEIN